MSAHDIRCSTLMFTCLKNGTWHEIVAPKTGEDFKIGDVATIFEFDEVASRYTGAPSITFRITNVSCHYADDSRIPHGFYLIAFEPIPPVHNAKVQQFVPTAKDSRIPATPRPQSRWPF